MNDRLTHLMPQLVIRYRFAAFLALSTLLLLVYQRFSFGPSFLDIPVAILVVGLTSVAALYEGARKFSDQRRYEIESRIRAQKSELYQHFAKVWIGFLIDPKMEAARKGNDAQTTQEQLFAFTPAFLMWSSNTVIEQYADLRSMYNREGVTPIEVGIRGPRQLGKILLSMRTELGHDPNRMNEDILLDVFMRDWRNYVTKLEATSQTGRTQ